MDSGAPSLRELALRLYEVGAVKFGQFTLKSGVLSPVYFDLRVIVSYPELLSEVSVVLWSVVKEYAGYFQSVCGVPYTALPMATVMSVNNNLPMLMRRKEAKDYGTERMVEGHVIAGSKCLVVEDVITTGSSVLDTKRVLQDVGVEVSHVVVLLDREQNGRQNIEKEGVTCLCAMTLSQLMGYLVDAGKVPAEVGVAVERFISAQRNGSKATGVASNGVNYHTPTPASPQHNRVTMSYSERSKFCGNILTAQLLSIMDRKKTNLAVSADLTSAAQITELADQVGPYVCMLKTHVDIVTDFSAQVAEELHMLARKHDFIIMEDRKFSDIGNTVRCQYQNKAYHLTSGWAELVTCHAISGPGIIKALKGAVSEGSGCVLVAEMSSEGTLASGSYTQSAIAMATTHQDFVVGVVCRSHLSVAPEIIHMTPGVKLVTSSDGLGQQYISPEEAVGVRHTDVIIVGRGITQAQDWVAAARDYRDAAYQAYLGRLRQ